MSIPLPPIDLDGHCSAVVDGTLYVLSQGGFQSLELKEKAKWQKEAEGVKVEGPACVTVSPNGNEQLASLWVIGGKTDKDDYDGLQVYSFANKAWQSIKTPEPVMQGRTNHSAAYLEDSQSILVYAGAQKETTNTLSSETFTVNIQEPYNVLSYTSDAPPANLPILQPWDSGSAVMVGGSTLNTQISIFNPNGGWRRLGTDLVTPLNPGSRGTLVDGADGSKVLEVYDMNVSPNTVTQVVLLGVDGSTARTGQLIGNGSGRPNNPPNLRRRALTLNDWPPYHQHLAPTAQRGDFSVVQDPNGRAVISGGNDKVPVALFNQRSNAWIDADDFFNVKNQQPLKPSTTNSNTLPSATSSDAAATGSGGDDNGQMLKVLGIILGVLFGIAFLFVLILFWLRMKKRKQREQNGWIEEKDHARRDMNGNERAGSFLKESGGGIQEIVPPPGQPWRGSNGNNPHSSVAIIAGKFGKRFSKQGSNNGHMQQHSNDSTAQLVKGRQAMGGSSTKALELADIEKDPQLQRRMTPRQERSDWAPNVAPNAVYGNNLSEKDAHTEQSQAKANRNRSSGWSKYFATSAPTGPNGLGHIPSGYVRKEDGSVQPANQPMSPVVEAEPRKTLDGTPVSHVFTGSPAFNDSRDDLAKRGSTATQAQAGVIVDYIRPRSQSESISSDNRSQNSSARNSAYQTSVTKPWNPTDNSFKNHLNSRPGSSDTDKRLPSRGKGGSSGFFPGAGTSYRPASKSPRLGATPAQPQAQSATTEWALPAMMKPAEVRDSSATVWPSHKPQQPSADYSKPAEQRFMANANTALPAPGFMGPQGESRDSTATVFPRGVPPAYYADGRGPAGAPAKPSTTTANANSDFGWLTLNQGGGQNRI